MRTQVGIVGAGPAGLMLSHLLHLSGITSIIVEERSRAYCEARVRAGLVEQWARDLIVKVGLGERLEREGLLHHGIKLNFGTGLHSVDFTELVGRAVTIYGQQELVKDMIAQRLADGGRILFEAEQVNVHALDSERPKIRFRRQEQSDEIDCDFIGGCDGFHGICRPSIPDGVLTVYEREYPFA
ncbi:MAG TPA: FAD-dependent monooxygenase, partial [Bradyrhizobium sp.]|nr:FAD-dependent monooxygenase [Bradyrhizobium sp.]